MTNRSGQTGDFCISKSCLCDRAIRTGSCQQIGHNLLDDVGHEESYATDHTGTNQVGQKVHRFGHHALNWVKQSRHLQCSQYRRQEE